MTVPGSIHRCAKLCCSVVCGLTKRRPDPDLDSRLCGISRSCTAVRFRSPKHLGEACARGWSYLPQIRLALSPDRSSASPEPRRGSRSSEAPPHFRQCHQLFLRWFRNRQIKTRERVANQLGDRDAREPFVIRRHDEPRRVSCAGLREHLFVGALVFIPSIALVQIARLKLPVFRRLVQPLQQAAALLLL